MNILQRLYRFLTGKVSAPHEKRVKVLTREQVEKLCGDVQSQLVKECEAKQKLGYTMMGNFTDDGQKIRRVK